MAIKFAVGSGNWSATGTWNGGALPVAGDDVYANNFTVTVDQDINVATLRNTSNVSPAITALGQFVVSGSSGTRNITLTNISQGVISAGSTVSNCALLINSTTGMTINLNTVMSSVLGNLYMFINGNCLLKLVGNITNIVNMGIIFTASAAGGTTNYIGTAVTNQLDSLQFNSGCINYTFNVTGNITSNGGFFRALAVGFTFTQVGNTTTTATACLNTSATSFSYTVTGNLNTTGNAPCILATNTSVGTITVNGNVNCSNNSHAIESLNASSITTITGNIVNSGTRMAIQVSNLRVSPSAAQTITIGNTSGGARVFYANNFANYPAVTDVRSGVVYSSGALTGTCAVPPALSVAYGVPVDNTTGLSIITRAQLITDVGAVVAAYTV